MTALNEGKSYLRMKTTVMATDINDVNIPMPTEIPIHCTVELSVQIAAKRNIIQR